MKIKKITLWSVDLTSHETYHMAEGKTCATVKTHILCLETDTGLKGWGEVCPIPHYLPAYADGVAPVMASPITIRSGSGPVPAHACSRSQAAARGAK